MPLCVRGAHDSKRSRSTHCCSHCAQCCLEQALSTLRLLCTAFLFLGCARCQSLKDSQLAAVQNSLSGIWPTLAKKCNPFASAFAKLSRSLFSHVGQLGVSTWIPTFKRPYCIFGPPDGCYPKLLHDRMTSSRKSQIPFANTIASFRENMFQALNP